MDSDRPHRQPSTSSSTSDLFICFTSRHHSSSSMKLPSKTSILSPGRTGRDPSFSLTTSLSRRLRTNRSIKGGASPATFPTTGKKRTGGFENQEPSSPKVTCIGQVRIKSKKKQGKRLRSLSRRRSIGGDVSFRKMGGCSRDGFSKSLNLGSGYHPGGSSFGSNQETEHRHNQRWVHLPLTICEALRAFGSEFSCLFPCRSSCFNPVSGREKDDHHRHSSGGGGSCAAVFTRWLVTYDDGGGGGRRDVELVVGDESEDECDNNNNNNNINDDGGGGGYDDSGSVRVSRRHVFDDLEIVNDRIQGGIDEGRVSICIPPKNALLLMRCRSDPLKMEALANRLWQSTVSQSDNEDEQEYVVEDQDYDDIIEVQQYYQQGNYYQEKNELKESGIVEENNNVQEHINDDEKQEQEEKEEDMTYFGSLFDEIVEEEVDDTKEVKVTEELFEESQTEKVKDDFEEGLPECLLLMMYEPKLSMEVSKETWVSSKDFIRRQSSRKKPPAPQQPPVKQTDCQSKVSASANTTTARLSNANKHVTAEPAAQPVQPGRSSCSLPAPSSMAEMLEQKLVNAVGYEPFVLTRCKSEPMRTAAAKLAPDNCFWKNRKLEPLRRASFGVGAAGVGF